MINSTSMNILSDDRPFPFWNTHIHRLYSPHKAYVENHKFAKYLKMRKIGILLITIIALSCDGQKNKKPIEKVKIEYISCNYKNETEDSIEFSRIVKDSANIMLIEGEIHFDENSNTLQKITNKQIISASAIDSIRSNLKNKGYREQFDQLDKVIFVQIQPKNENDLHVLDLRHSVEDKIDQILSDNELGHWIAGDLGPGGANMLFEVTNWDKAIPKIMKVLNQEGILSQTLITKRLNTAEDDWNYEVIYPIDFNGAFNQM